MSTAPTAQAHTQARANMNPDTNPSNGASGGGGANHDVHHARLKELWAALNAMAERNANQLSASTTTAGNTGRSSSPPSPSASPTPSGTIDPFAAAEAELSDISRQIRQTIKALGSSPCSPSSSAEVGQMEDLVRLLEEMQQMQAAHRSRRVREEQQRQQHQQTPQVVSADGRGKGVADTHSHSSDDDDDDDDADDGGDKGGYEARRAAKADAAAARQYHEEQLHQATVDAVMAAMADHLPKFSDHLSAPSHSPATASSCCDAPLDDVTLSMAMELLVDADIRQSFVDLKAQLGAWMAANGADAQKKGSGSSGCHTPADWERYEGQLRVATELTDFYASAECVAVIAQHLQQQQSDELEVRRVATRFNSLMNALTAFGDAPNGMYGPQ